MAKEHEVSVRVSQKRPSSGAAAAGATSDGAKLVSADKMNSLL
jgi:hypothetical protein